jgi:hypothetical protein
VIDLPLRVRDVHDRIAAAAARAGRAADAVRIVAVTKRQRDTAIAEAYAAGLRDIGENYAQELSRKRAGAAAMPGLRWHFIGTLQTNKARAVVGEADLVHAVDSEKLAREIDKRAAAAGVVQVVLVAVNVAGEDTKSGVAPGELPALLAAIAALPAVQCRGLMTMPPLAGEPEDNRRHFAALRALRDAHVPGGELSMGTTGDYEVAVEEGATLVRLGTVLFGARG